VIPLSDGGGEVVALGPEATRFPVGEQAAEAYRYLAARRHLGQVVITI
jgi:hypothetical protein